MLRAFGFAMQGAQNVWTAGHVSQNVVQETFPFARITVYLTGTTALATIFHDNLTPPTPLANPFTADENGWWWFYAGDGRYDVMITPRNMPDCPWTMADIYLGDVSGAISHITAPNVFLDPTLDGWTNVQDALSGLQSSIASITLTAPNVGLTPAIDGWTNVQQGVEGLNNGLNSLRITVTNLGNHVNGLVSSQWLDHPGGIHYGAGNVLIGTDHLNENARLCIAEEGSVTTHGLDLERYSDDFGSQLIYFWKSRGTQDAQTDAQPGDFAMFLGWGAKAPGFAPTYFGGPTQGAIAAQVMPGGMTDFQFILNDGTTPFWGTAVMRITPNGDVNIIGSNPVYRINGVPLSFDATQVNLNPAVNSYVTVQNAISSMNTAIHSLTTGAGGAAGAPGQIQFNAAGVLAASPDFVWSAGGHVGIGDPNPVGILTVVTDSGGHGIRSERYSSDVGPPVIYLHKGRGTVAAPLPIQVGDSTGYIGLGGQVSIGSGADIAEIQAVVTGVFPNNLAGDMIFSTNDGTAPNGTGYERMRITHDGKVAIGTTVPQFALDVNGDCNLSAGNIYRIGGQPLAAGADGSLQFAHNGIFAAAHVGYWEEDLPLNRFAHLYIYRELDRSIVQIGWDRNRAILMATRDDPATTRREFWMEGRPLRINTDGFSGEGPTDIYMGSDRWNLGGANPELPWPVPWEDMNVSIGPKHSMGGGRSASWLHLFGESSQPPPDDTVGGISFSNFLITGPDRRVAMVTCGAGYGVGYLSFQTALAGVLTERMRIAPDGRIDITGSLFVNGQAVQLI